MEVVALIRRVFLHLIPKISDRFLEQRNNHQFCVKLGKSSSDTCAMLSDAHGGEAVKNSVFLSVMNGSKTVARTWKIMKDAVTQDLSVRMKMMKKCGMWRIRSTELFMCKY
jgi:hypothetical protein